MDDPVHGVRANAEFLGDFLDSLTLPFKVFGTSEKGDYHVQSSITSLYFTNIISFIDYL